MLKVFDNFGFEYNVSFNPDMYQLLNFTNSQEQ